MSTRVNLRPCGSKLFPFDEFSVRDPVGFEARPVGFEPRPFPFQPFSLSTGPAARQGAVRARRARSHPPAKQRTSSSSVVVPSILPFRHHTHPRAPPLRSRRTRARSRSRARAVRRAMRAARSSSDGALTVSAMPLSPSLSRGDGSARPGPAERRKEARDGPREASPDSVLNDSFERSDDPEPRLEAAGASADAEPDEEVRARRPPVPRASRIVFFPPLPPSSCAPVH